jgi:hypothetical protein
VVPAGRTVRLRIRLTAGGRAVRGVRVRVAGRASRPTDRRGVTTVRVRFARPGKIRLTFTRRGSRPARTTLTVRRG